MVSIQYFGYLLGGISSMFVGVLHIAIIIKGADWYRLFGAGEEMATWAEEGRLKPHLITAVLVIVFFVWAGYAFSAIELIPYKFPLENYILMAVAGIYLLRGLALFPMWLFKLQKITAFWIWSSIIPFLIGCFYAIGLKGDQL